MNVAKLALMLVNINSCDDVLKKLFLDDATIFVRSVEEALRNGLLNKLAKDVDELGHPEDAHEQQVVASLIILLLYGGNTHVSKAVHKILDYVAIELNSYTDDSLIAFVKSLGINADFNDKCFASSIYVATKKSRYAVSKLCYRYRIHFIDYIKMARNLLTEESWRIVSHPISNGYIYIDRRDKVIRLIIEYLRNSLISKLRSILDSCQHLKSLIDSTSISEEIKDVIKVNELDGESRAHGVAVKPQATSIRYQFEDISSVEELYRISSKFFPPCITNIMESLRRGENLSHHQRFALATFLLNIGVPQNIVVDLFRQSPDFNERITRYQIEHLAGLRGSKKRYLTYSCSTMKALGMCKWECNIKNPIQYPSKAVKNVNKTSADVANTNEKQ